MLTRGTKKAGKLNWQAGQELAEFAIVLPLLLIVFIGVMDLGRAFHASITVSNATRAGARFAVSFGYLDNGPSVVLQQADIRDRVVNEAQNSGITIDPLLIDIVCDPVGCPRGTGSVTVTATYNFQLLFNSFMGTGFDMTYSSEMKIPW